METPTIKNPFSKGKVVGSVERGAYMGSEHPRGHVQFAMSRGELMEFNRCPHRWLMGIESEETKATEWGTLIDCLVLTPERFDSHFIVPPAEYPSKPKRKDEQPEMKPWNRNATFCKEWEDEHDGQSIVKPSLMDDAERAVKVLMDDDQIKALVECSRKQVMVIGEYHDTETELTIPVKAMLDLEPERESKFCNSLADLKTCNTASPGPWARAVFEHNYHVQAAFYIDLHAVATGDERIDFLHVLQESYAPWEVGKRLLSNEFIQIGRLTYLAALRRYCRCLKANVWPGYDSEGKMILNGWNLTEPLPYMINLP